MVSSTASAVNPRTPTEFVYEEQDGVVWGTYTGDTVTIGRFVGTRAGDRLEIDYVHLLKAGGRSGGHSTSRIEPLSDGRLRLVEEFRFAGDDKLHESICDELR
ncbi:hypothetical protein Ssi02_21510 [Sinosporangium siamense]|uniref:Uncharacterized protein n=2 Tax=Sinosporangium siamense TaxID=1367973 RepID=A0A919V4G4_9ACTN|nr:hypothetical protein Ssi02_21510 [Sinosporangium siamense]